MYLKGPGYTDSLYITVKNTPLFLSLKPFYSHFCCHGHIFEQNSQVNKKSFDIKIKDKTRFEEVF